MSGWVLEAPGKPGSARRLAWLEAEYARLGFECQYLEAANQNLTRRLEGEEDDAVEPGGGGGEAALSPDQVALETEPGPAPGGHPPGLPAKGETGGSPAEGGKANRRVSRVNYRTDPDSEEPDLTRYESAGSTASGLSQAKSMMQWMGTYTNAAVMKGSALGKSKPVQAAIYAVAFAGVIFVLVATATHLGAPDDGHGGDHGDAAGGHGDAAGDAAAGADAGGGHHRRLGGAAPALLKNIAFSLVGAGMCGYIIHMVRLPLIVGYWLGGILVGPIVLGIVTGYQEIDEIAELGLLFLLFMIGMELDFHKLFSMDRVVLVAGLFQFPVSAGAMYFIFSFLKEVTGLSLGDGPHSMLYTSLTCSVSSTMIVTRMLAEKFEMDSPAGVMTDGILMCQDIWAIVVLAVQPTVHEPNVGQVVKNLFMIVVLIAIALAYAKFVMPPVLLHASQSVELMLVLSLSWCFFICSAAILPFVGLSMELAAIIAGCALATFPYSQDFNGKIKYIRDFFITLFFAGVGMNVPVPEVDVIAKAILVVVVVLAIRWICIFGLLLAVGGEPRIAALSTINISQISEFAIVICSMGVFEGGGFGHIEKTTMTIVVWAFIILAVLNSCAIRYNQQIVRSMVSVMKRAVPSLRRATSLDVAHEDEGEDVFEEESRDIIFLGFHKVAALLIAEFQIRHPGILKRIHIIDINPGHMSGLREKGIKCSWGDFASAKELAGCHKGAVHVVISSIPDSLLQGVTNMKLLKVAKSVWPEMHFIATADNPFQAQGLYEAGADYVVRMAKLCAERLHELLTDHCTHAFGAGELTELFEQYKTRDKDAKSKKGFLSLKV